MNKMSVGKEVGSDEQFPFEPDFSLHSLGKTITEICGRESESYVSMYSRVLQ